jgi:predicted DNA-binding transcriptional regulator YafY
MQSWRLFSWPRSAPISQWFSTSRRVDADAALLKFVDTFAVTVSTQQIMGSKTERFYKIELMIRHRGQVSFDEMLAALEVSRATLKRDLQFLRDRMGAPIVYDRAENAYRFADEGHTGDKHELPGLWFDQKELYALLMAHHLLSDLDPEGTLSRHMGPLLDRVHQLLGSTEVDATELMRRVRIVGSARRSVGSQCFEVICAALLQRRRVQMQYFTRSRKARSVREVSPQRLIHYRNTWYLDAWCHESEALRRFALDAVENAQPSERKARNLSLKRVEEEMDGGYGIFAGNKVQWAQLRFTAQAAPWVSQEAWHPLQETEVDDTGALLMKLPYGEPTELIMDILRWGPDVEVLRPAPLKQAVAVRLAQACAQYR